MTGYDIILRQTADIMKASETAQAEIDETLAVNGQLFRMLVDEPDQRKFPKDAMEWYGRELDKKGLTQEERQQKMAEFTRGLLSVNNPWMRCFLPPTRPSSGLR